MMRLALSVLIMLSCAFGAKDALTDLPDFTIRETIAYKPYSNELFNGKGKIYTRDGILAIGTFKDGKLISPMETWGADGSLTQRITPTHKPYKTGWYRFESWKSGAKTQDMIYADAKLQSGYIQKIHESEDSRICYKAGEIIKSEPAKDDGRTSEWIKNCLKAAGC